MKKSIFDFIQVSCNCYAPESFKAFFRGEEIDFSIRQKQELGYIYLTKGLKEVEKEIKRIFRKYSYFADKKIIYKTMGIRTNESKSSFVKIDSCGGYGKVDIYNITQKLNIFKAIKKAYNENSFNIKVVTGSMIEYEKWTKATEEEIQKPELLNKIIYI